VAILAHDEEARVAATIEQLKAQSLLREAGVSVEVVVVANGCRDRTVKVARGAFDPADTGFRVVDLPERGKTNAWNRFVRDFASPAAEIFVFMDADITFLTPDTLARLCAALDAQPGAQAAVGDSVKTLDRRQVHVAQEKIEEWIAWATRSRLAPFVKVARTIRRHLDGILTYVSTGLNNGRSEGLNGKIRTLTRRAFGFHDASSLIGFMFLCCTGLNLSPGHRTPA
jgi:glycosyltransferase involved in cell wall biosynthesis